MLTADQLAMAIDKLRPNASYRRYDTYENLVATWDDDAECPSEDELVLAWEIYDKEQKIDTLNAVYQLQFGELAQALGMATLDGNQEVIDSIKADYASLKAEYQAKMEEIYNGNS